MRRFRFKGDPKNYTLWDKKPVFDMVYNKEDYRKYRGGPDCDYVFDNVLSGTDDWQEVLEEPQVFNRVHFNEKTLHKDTDLGHFAGLFVASFTEMLSDSDRLDHFSTMVGMKHNESLKESVVRQSISLAKELIKQLDQETK